MKRPLAVLTIPLAVLGFVACGDDDDDGTDTTTATTVSSTEPVATTAATTAETTAETTGDTAGGGTLPGGITLPSLPDITLPGGATLPSLPDVSDIEEQVKQQFVQLGMTEEQAQCLVDKIDISSGQMPDLSSIMDLLDECDINIGDLNPDG